MGRPGPAPARRTALARRIPPHHDPGMAHLLRNLDRVVWVLTTAIMVVTALAVLGFLFLAAGI
jgi:hypothetical protein